MKNFYVLFCDSYAFRHSEFRVRADTKAVLVIRRHVCSIPAFKKAVTERKFDVIFLPSYWTEGRSAPEDKKEEQQEIVNCLLALDPNSRPNLIVYHGYLDECGTVRKLLNGGIPAAHVPWSFNNPTVHVREPVK